MQKQMMVWGLGNPLQGDDRAGIEVAKGIQQAAPAHIHAIACETTPGNFIPLIRRERPQDLILVDAADMGLPPGSIRRIPADLVSEACFTSHDFSIDLMLRDALGRARLTLIGIQPQDVRLSLALSPSVLSAVDEVIQALLEASWLELPPLERATS